MLLGLPYLFGRLKLPKNAKVNLPTKKVYSIGRSKVKLRQDIVARNFDVNGF